MGAWEFLGQYQFADKGEKPDPASIHDAIRESRIEVQRSPYSDLVIDGRRFRLRPR